MFWEQKDKWYTESDKQYRVCATWNCGVIIYDAWAPRPDLKGYSWIENTTDPAAAKQLCETHFNQRQE